MILELHHQELQDYSQPFIQEQNYYAVEYDKTFYIGQALKSLDSHCELVEFKFSTVANGQEVYEWTRRDNLDIVHVSHVFLWHCYCVWCMSFHISTIEQSRTCLPVVEEEQKYC